MALLIKVAANVLNVFLFQVLKGLQIIVLDPADKNKLKRSRLGVKHGAVIQ
jgi:hypothetical protein